MVPMKFHPFLLVIVVGVFLASCKSSRFQNFNKQKFLKGRLAQKFEESSDAEASEQTKEYYSLDEYTGTTKEDWENEQSGLVGADAEEVHEEQVFEGEISREEVFLEEEFRTVTEKPEIREEAEVIPKVETEETNSSPRDFQTEMSLFFYVFICVLAVICYLVLGIVFALVLGPWVLLVALGLIALSIALAIILHVHDFDFMDGILAWYLYTALNAVLVLGFAISMWILTL